jgi:hypothetical protein
VKPHPDDPALVITVGNPQRDLDIRSIAASGSLLDDIYDLRLILTRRHDGRAGDGGELTCIERELADCGAP